MHWHSGMIRALAILAVGMLMMCPAPASGMEWDENDRPFFDESADARAQLAAAMVDAKRENQRILVIFGGNWNEACTALEALLTSHQSVSHKVSYEYVVVPIDIGRWDKNMDLAARYRADLRWHGVPYLMILDAEGVVLARSGVGALETNGEIDPRKLIDLLTEHQAPYKVATDLLRQGLAEARQERKRTFLYFGAPWCNKCRSYDRWLQLPEVAPLVGEDFHVVKIDVNRTVGGQKMLNEIRNAGYGIPWVAILDEEGSVLASSTTADGTNIGFPYTDWELDEFRAVLRAGAVQMSASEIDKIIDSMRVFHPALKADSP